MNDDIATLRAVAKDKIVVNDISELLYRHKCLFLLSKLGENKYSIKAKTQETFNRMSVKETYHVCRPFFVSFSKMGIKYAVFKGAVLSQAAYGDIRYRTSGDIDILINRESVDEVKKMLLSNGFIQGRIGEGKIIPFTREELLFQSGLSHQIAPFVKQVESTLCPFVNVDINTNILWGESKIKANMEYVLEQTEDSEIFGIFFKKLKKEMDFISLCLHHYKDMNSLYMLYSNKLMLGLFSDIYFFLLNQRPDAKKLLYYSSRIGVTKYLYYCIYYTQKLFEDIILEEYLSTLYSLEAEEILDTYGLDDRERKIWQLGFYERVLKKDIRPYLDLFLNEADKRKISKNIQYM